MPPNRCFAKASSTDQSSLDHAVLDSRTSVKSYDSAISRLTGRRKDHHQPVLYRRSSYGVLRGLPVRFSIQRPLVKLPYTIRETAERNRPASWPGRQELEGWIVRRRQHQIANLQLKIRLPCQCFQALKIRNTPVSVEKEQRRQSVHKDHGFNFIN